MCVSQKNDLFTCRAMQELFGFSYQGLLPNFRQLQQALLEGHSDVSDQKLEGQPQASNERTTSWHW